MTGNVPAVKQPEQWVEVMKWLKLGGWSRQVTARRAAATRVNRQWKDDVQADPTTLFGKAVTAG